MKSIRYIPAAAALFGVLGAILRGLNLRTGYEPGSCLPIPGNVPQTLLILLSAACVIGLLIWSRALKGRRGVSFERTFACSASAYKLVAVFTAAAMAAAGALGFFLLLTGRQTVPGASLHQPTALASFLNILPLIPLWLLAIGSAGSFLVLASAQNRGHITESRAVFSLLPMFWACFDLIITFKDNGASPFVSLYAFELFAAIALVFSFYALAGFFYTHSNPARFIYAGSLSVVFCFTCLGGYIVCWLLGGGPVALSFEAMLRYACFGGASVYLLANLWIAANRLSAEPPAQPVPAETEECEGEDPV